MSQRTTWILLALWVIIFIGMMYEKARTAAMLWPAVLVGIVVFSIYATAKTWPKNETNKTETKKNEDS
jgi:hypothetical protein